MMALQEKQWHFEQNLISSCLFSDGDIAIIELCCGNINVVCAYGDSLARCWLAGALGSLVRRWGHDRSIGEHSTSRLAPCSVCYAPSLLAVLHMVVLHPPEPLIGVGYTDSFVCEHAACTLLWR